MNNAFQKAVEQQAATLVSRVIARGVEMEATETVLATHFAKHGISFGEVGYGGLWVWQLNTGVIVDETCYITFHELIAALFAYVETHPVEAKAEAPNPIVSTTNGKYGS